MLKVVMAAVQGESLRSVKVTPADNPLRFALPPRRVSSFTA